MFKILKVYIIIIILFIIPPLKLLSHISEHLNNSEGIIRVTFKDWEYDLEPYTIGSIERLGEAKAYFICIYSAEYIKEMQRLNEESIKLTGEIGNIVSLKFDNKLGIAAPKGARSFFEPELHAQVISCFNNGGGLRIIIENPRPLYLDIPVPTGKYFLAYIVYFPNARNKKIFTCPFYKAKSCVLSDTWGPSNVDVVEDNIAFAEFTPRPICWEYIHSDLIEFKLRWEDTENFAYYIDFLNWSGAID